MKFTLVVPGIVATLLASPAAAGNSLDLINAMMRLPISMSSGSMTYEGVVARLSDPIRLYDLNNDGLSAEDIAVVSQVKAARTRAGTISRFLAFDLNNDREVSRDEIDQADRVSSNGGGDARQMRAQFAVADLDGNGVLDWSEMGTPANGDGDSTLDRSLQTIVALDPTPTTSFMLADAKALADQLFLVTDTDKNGVLDRTEITAARGRPLQ